MHYFRVNIFYGRRVDLYVKKILSFCDKIFQAFESHHIKTASVIAHWY